MEIFDSHLSHWAPWAKSIIHHQTIYDSNVGQSVIVRLLAIQHRSKVQSTTCGWFAYWNWWFCIAMFVYQRVPLSAGRIIHIIHETEFIQVWMPVESGFLSFSILGNMHWTSESCATSGPASRPKRNIFDDGGTKNEPPTRWCPIVR